MKGALSGELLSTTVSAELKAPWPPIAVELRLKHATTDPEAGCLCVYRSLYNTAIIGRLLLTWFPNPPAALASPLRYASASFEAGIIWRGMAGT